MKEPHIFYIKQGEEFTLPDRDSKRYGNDYIIRVVEETNVG